MYSVPANIITSL